MKKERIEELKKELKYLVSSEIEKEIELNEKELLNENINVKEIANNIYLKRGLDIKKINNTFLEKLIIIFSEMLDIFKNKDSKLKKRMLLDLIYIALIILFIKVPIDLIRDIGYEYLEILTTSDLIYNIWNIIFLIIYTISLLCAFIVLLKNFNNKYKNTK